MTEVGKELQLARWMQPLEEPVFQTVSWSQAAGAPSKTGGQRRRQLIGRPVWGDREGIKSFMMAEVRLKWLSEYSDRSLGGTSTL